MHIGIAYSKVLSPADKERSFRVAREVLLVATKVRPGHIDSLLEDVEKGSRRWFNVRTLAEAKFLKSRLHFFDIVYHDEVDGDQSDSTKATLRFNPYHGGCVDKISAIRVLRAWANMGLREAKTLLDDLQAWPGSAITIEVADSQFFPYANAFMNAWTAAEPEQEEQMNEKDRNFEIDIQRLRDLCARMVQDGHYEEACLLLDIIQDMDS